MTEIDVSRAEWHKSSYSSQDGNCVEVARNLPGLVAVRDSKSPDAPNLAGLLRDLASVPPNPPCLANPTRGTGHHLIEPERAWFTPPVRPPWA